MLFIDRTFPQGALLPPTKDSSLCSLAGCGMFAKGTLSRLDDLGWGGPLVLKANSGARRVASEDLPFSQMILPKVFVGKITWYQFLLIPAYTFSFFIILWVVWWGNNAYYHSASIPEKTGTRENWYASLLSILLTWAKHILRYRTTWSHGMPYMNSTPLLRPLRVSFHTF